MLIPFPREGQMAEAFYREAARHLQDARVLHRSQRHPGSITSAMKAVELGLKSVLIIDGATGWMAEVFKITKFMLKSAAKKSEPSQSDAELFGGSHSL